MDNIIPSRFFSLFRPLRKRSLLFPWCIVGKHFGKKASNKPAVSGSDCINFTNDVLKSLVIKCPYACGKASFSCKSQWSFVF